MAARSRINRVGLGLASLLVPGLGQWLTGRSDWAIALFVATSLTGMMALGVVGPYGLGLLCYGATWSFAVVDAAIGD